MSQKQLYGRIFEPDVSWSILVIHESVPMSTKLSGGRKLIATRYIGEDANCFQGEHFEDTTVTVGCQRVL